METEGAINRIGAPDDHPAIPAESAFLSRKEVARLFGVSLSTVTRWARTGLLQTVRTPGGHYRYRAEDMRRAARSGDAENSNVEARRLS
jgi:excisionase family DNA binding protein